MSLLVLPRGGRREILLPQDAVDAIILWWRERGRAATVVWCPTAKCPEVRVKFLPGDPRLRGFQEGLYATDYESYFLYHPDEHGAARAYDLGQLGASGVRDLLDKANLWSGRGDFASLHEAINAVAARNAAHEAAVQKALEEAAFETAVDRWRQDMGVPFVGVRIDLKNNKET